MNLSLCTLRNIDIELAEQERIAFADVFWPMLSSGFTARQKYGADYTVAGKDGVHPGWAGQTVMAYAFLKAMGLDGDIGTFTVDFAGGKASASAGHEVVASKAGEVTIKSNRYPFCATGDEKSDATIRSGMTLVPFNQELNRLLLVVKNAPANGCNVTWGAETKTYSAEQLNRGVNLTTDFATNPFSDAFKKVDEAVLAKQAYETKQIKKEFRSPEAKASMEAVVARTEQERAPLAAAIKAAFVPVTHTIKITAQ